MIVNKRNSELEIEVDNNNNIIKNMTVYHNNRNDIDDDATSTTITHDDISESYGSIGTNSGHSIHSSSRRRRPSNIMLPSLLQCNKPTKSTTSDNLPQQQQQSILKIENVNFLKILGEGQFGQVWLATTDEKSILEPMAVKVLSKFNLVEAGDSSIVDNLIREVEILRELQNEIDIHPCLVQMIEAKQDTNLVYIFQEFCSGGELFSLLHGGSNILQTIPNAVQFYTACIADALHYLHTKGIIYRDLKPENIMIRQNNGYPVLIDFGYAKHIKKQQQPIQQQQSRRRSSIKTSGLGRNSGHNNNNNNNNNNNKIFDLVKFYENKDTINKDMNNNNNNIDQQSEHSRRSVVKFNENNNIIEPISESTRGERRYSKRHSIASQGTNMTNWYTCKDNNNDSDNDSSCCSFDDDDNDSYYMDSNQYEDKCYSMIGTPKYVAPEIILGEGYDYRADLWALGITIYEMFTGYNPMVGPDIDNNNNMDDIELYRCITEEDYVPLPNDILEKEINASNLIHMLLIRNQKERIKSSYDVIQHEWFSNIDFNDIRQQKVIAPWIPNNHNNNDNTLDTIHFDDYCNISNDPNKCIFKTSYPILKKKEIALFNNHVNVFR